MTNAANIQLKISFIQAHVRNGNTEEALNGLDELNLMFVKFCTEVDAEVTAVANEIREIHNSLSNMIGEFSGERTS